MAFYCDKMTWKAGNLTKDPYFRTYPDGNETVYLSLAIDHEKDNTEYLELQGRGQIKEYIRTETFKSGDFVIAGGTLGTRKNSLAKYQS
ncbi:single-stranded DNA-binding protein [Bifidobacterium xylocopae]|uniref:Uncharacterized protein n=1 Tax=Bifidobacterium xylocopae TaxID=2493119 RepID=A0A366KAY8_9BIFI|nr:single-stranded DNA-binding protein [Bifidobacterium xylocopae]RBP98895.1 hypothetical protein CRD59_06565 [Bifidobacterium xylocopae]